MNGNSVSVVLLFIFGLLLGAMIGYELSFQENYNESYEIGYQEGITYQAQVDVSNIVLGLVYIPNSGYYIVNQNYENFKVNTTSQVEAIGYLSNEISPCEEIQINSSMM